jgi:hypothetical protein
MIAVNKPLFRPGRIVATPAALNALERSGQSVWVFLSRHLAGDWGVVDSEDKTANDESLRDGSRLLSAYLLDSGDDGDQRQAVDAWGKTEFHAWATCAINCIG